MIKLNSSFFWKPNLPPSKLVDHYNSLLRIASKIGVGKNTIFFTNPFHALVILFQMWDPSLTWWLQHNTHFRLVPHFLFLFGLIQLRRKWRRIWRLKEFGCKVKSTHFTNKINKTSSWSTSPRPFTLVFGQQSFKDTMLQVICSFLAPKKISQQCTNLLQNFLWFPPPFPPPTHT